MAYLILKVQAAVMVPFWKISSYGRLQEKDGVDEETCELHKELIEKFAALVDAGENDMCRPEINPLIQQLGDFDGDFEMLHQEYRSLRPFVEIYKSNNKCKDLETFIGEFQNDYVDGTPVFTEKKFEGVPDEEDSYAQGSNWFLHTPISLEIPFCSVLEGLEDYKYSGIWVCIRDYFIPLTEADAESFDIEKLNYDNGWICYGEDHINEECGYEGRTKQLFYAFKNGKQVDLEEQVFWGESYEEYVHPEDRMMEEEEEE